MQSENPLLADFAKLMNSAVGTLAGATREARDAGRERLREALGGLDFVSREEFEAVKAMAAKAREDADEARAKIAAMEAMMEGGQEALAARLAHLAAMEARLDALEGKPAPKSKPAAKTKPAQ